jgi:hypothetical protein
MFFDDIPYLFSVDQSLTVAHDPSAGPVHVSEHEASAAAVPAPRVRIPTSSAISAHRPTAIRAATLVKATPPGSPLVVLKINIRWARRYELLQ